MHTSSRRSVIRSGIAAATALSMSVTLLAPVATAAETGPGAVVSGTTASAQDHPAGAAADGQLTAVPVGSPTPPDDYTPPAPSGSAAQLSSGFNVLNSTESLSGKSLSLSATLGPTGIIGLGWLFALAFVIARQANILPAVPVDFSPSADALQGLSSQILPPPAR